MDQLSSCYFCGGALDVSLSEYPVVPRDLRADDTDGTTVVLCQTCRKKLATVVEDVVAATGVESHPDNRSFEGTGFEPSEPEKRASEEPLFEEREEDGPVSSEGSVRSDRAEDSDTAGRSDERTTATNGIEDGPESRSSQPTDDGSTGHTDSAGNDGADHTGPADSDTDDGADSADHTAGDDTDSGGRSGAATDDDGGDDGPSMSRLEYNKVMRLLKNREFPIDRMEIRDVATSAYQISPEEFDAVIEAAIERDLIAEENGQFVDPT